MTTLWVRCRGTHSPRRHLPGLKQPPCYPPLPLARDRHRPHRRVPHDHQVAAETAQACEHQDLAASRTHINLVERRDDGRPSWLVIGEGCVLRCSRSSLALLAGRRRARFLELRRHGAATRVADTARRVARAATRASRAIRCATSDRAARVRTSRRGFVRNRRRRCRSSARCRRSPPEYGASSD